MALERDIILAWLRSGEGIGGDDYVANTIANAIENDEHIRWSIAKADQFSSTTEEAIRRCFVEAFTVSNKLRDEWRKQVYEKAIVELKDPAKLRTLADAYEKEGLKKSADMLRARAKELE